MHTTVASNRRRGFTMIEIMVVVVILSLLIALLIPLLGRARANATKAITTAQIQSIQAALESYYSDHKKYPPSHLLTSYGPINPGQGSLLLSQGLMGYLSQPIDGAGPMNAGDQPVPGGDPLYGFRTHKPQVMGGKIFGPYIEPGRKGYVRLPENGGKPGEREFFVDGMEHDIIYYASRGAPTASPQLLFGYTEGKQDSFFYGSDNMSTANSSFDPSGPTKNTSTVNITTASPEFMKMIYPSINTADPAIKNIMNRYNGGVVLGSDSYLLISPGSDEIYFTVDDFVVAKP